LQLPGEIFYWRERNFEVDYVVKYGKKIWAIEVKYGKKTNALGLDQFKKKYPTAELLLITPDNFNLQINYLKALMSK